MGMVISQTYVGIVVTLLGSFLPKLGVEVGSDELTTTLSVIITVIGGLWAFWGRYRKGDVAIVGVKK